MAGPLDALERMMEGAVEGTVQRILRPKLQPVLLAKAAARAMEEQQIVGPNGPEVPNNYTISLHPRDFEGFARFQLALERELEKYLIKYAADRGWRPVSTTTVALLADAGVRAGRPRVQAKMLDAALSGPSPSIDEPPLASTARRPRVRPALRAEARRMEDTAYLAGAEGEGYRLGPAVTRVGRALENEIVLPDSSVSRFHAEIRREGSEYVLYDLGSTNGTLVADVSIDRRPLADGDRVGFGLYRLTFRHPTRSAEERPSPS